MHKKLTTVAAWMQIAISILKVSGMRIDTPKGTVDFHVEKLGAKKIEKACSSLCNVETRWPKSRVGKNIKEGFDISGEPYDSSIFPHFAGQLRKLGYENVPNYPVYGINSKNITWSFKADDGFSILIEIGVNG